VITAIKNAFNTAMPQINKIMNLKNYVASIKEHIHGDSCFKTKQYLLEN